jgi:hypothetical protein
MLEHNDREFIEAKLLAAVELQVSPRQALVSGLQDLAGELPEGAATFLVPAAVDLCVRDAYRRTPPALVHMLRTLLPNVDGVRELILRIQTPAPASPDPFNALILDTKLPFLDRVATREYLRKLVQPNPTQPVVVVAGDRKNGKSYTSEFIDYLSRHIPDTLPCRVVVEETQGSSIGPQELARDLVTAVGGDPLQEPPPNTNTNRWAQELANWVVSEARKSQTRCWFILDGFNEKELRDDTSTFIVKLSMGLTTGLARRFHRLILIDFDRTVLPLQPGMIAADVTAPIPAAAVVAAVSEVVRASAKQLDEAQIYAKLMEGLPDPVVDLPELGSRFRDLMEVL